MNIRVTAASYLVVTLALGAVSARAQGGPPETAPGSAASLAARIAALEARVAALETIDESDIVGTYKYQVLGIELNRGFAGTPGTPARVNSEASDAVIVLKADHTGEATGTTGRCTLPVLALGIVTCQTDDQPATFTWSFANGVLTIHDPEHGPLEFAVPASGVIVHGCSTEFLPGHSWANIGILVKISK
jgi:hypothetical protein